MKATILIDNKELIIFANHWKAKSTPESTRVVYAKALKKEIDKLDNSARLYSTWRF